MKWALVNLDNGLFFEKGLWTAHFELAETFAQLHEVAAMASRHNVSTGAAVGVFEHEREHNSRPIGFLWLTDSSWNAANAGSPAQP